ncbi:MAG: hypothetical protein AAFO94_14635, partial [Bacteroidota bacterium]
MRCISGLILIFFIVANNMFAQTCCSGGVPVSSNLGLPASDAGALQFSLSYDLNVLKTLKAGTEVLDDQSRNRTTHSVLLELGYAFNQRFSIDGFFSFVRQERTIRQFGNRNFTASQGPGDAVLLFKYRILDLNDHATQLTGALGIKAPLGPADLRDSETGIILNADLQPGSGAWDGLLWAQLNHIMSFRPSMSMVVTSTYATKGKNNSYFGSQVYQFGNEWQLSFGVSDRITSGALLFDPALLFRYRTVAPDR